MGSIRNNGTHVKLNDGRLMPLLGLGTWAPPKEGLFSSEGLDIVTAAVESALTEGYRHIDTAYNYMNEEAVGQGIHNWIKNTGGKREDVFVVTKLPFVAMHPDRVEKFLKLSLNKMKLDYVDLYLIHLPIGMKYNNDTDLFPLKEDGTADVDYGSDTIAVWKEMINMQKKGFAKSIGVSNFNVGQVRRLVAQNNVIPAVNQVEMHVEMQQPGLRRYCAEVGVVVSAFGNLGSPGRKGTFTEIGTEIPSLMENPVVNLVADNHKVQPAQVLLKYLVQLGCPVVPKSATPSRIASNGKLFDWTLSPLEMKALASLDRGEEGRTFRFLKAGGMETHPECPAPMDL